MGENDVIKCIYGNLMILVIDFGESRIRSNEAEDFFPTIKTGTFGTKNYLDPYMINNQGTLYIFNINPRIQ